MKKDTITFDWTKYPIRILEIDGNEVYISTKSLDNALFHDGEYVSAEAERIDDIIHFFVDDDKIDLDDDALQKIVTDRRI